jgi:hypothetical protein
MAPIVHGLEVEYYQRINFIYLDIDDPGTDPLKKELGFRYQPHFFLINPEGDIIQQWVGPVDAERFRESFNNVLEE